MSDAVIADGVHGMVPREKMTESARLLRETYAITPGLRLFQREFGYYCLERWYEQGLGRQADLAEEFSYDQPGQFTLGNIGWCEGAFVPAFEEKVLEQRGEHEVIQDHAGRHLLVFKGRRQGFMPEYLDHPVKDMKTWQEQVKWRMDPDTPQRYAHTEALLDEAADAAAKGLQTVQRVGGGYMYLRSLMGPEGLLYKFYDEPELIHDCMETWLRLALAVTVRHQQRVTFDEVFFGEDICYNHGSLISRAMAEEFLFPYYQELITQIKGRQLDRERHLYVQIDTDGFANEVIDWYREAIGMDMMSPFEVASGCDVVEVGKRYPDLIISGGIDKRILAQGKRAIDQHLEYILPAMRERGGYIPTCDHGVPEEVSLENYRYYRQRCLELGC